jgi:DeoR/GlpR family transcriptional regulator of sugar metabolism
LEFGFARRDLSFLHEQFLLRQHCGHAFVLPVKLIRELSFNQAFLV